MGSCSSKLPLDAGAFSGVGPNPLPSSASAAPLQAATPSMPSGADLPAAAAAAAEATRQLDSNIGVSVASAVVVALAGGLADASQSVPFVGAALKVIAAVLRHAQLVGEVSGGAKALRERMERLDELLKKVRQDESSKLTWQHVSDVAGRAEGTLKALAARGAGVKAGATRFFMSAIDYEGLRALNADLDGVVSEVTAALGADAAAGMQSLDRDMNRGFGDILGHLERLSERPRVADALPALWPSALARRDLLHLPLQLDADLWAALALSTPPAPLPFTGLTTVVAVCGMAGCGKSGAVKELAWAARTVGAYPGGTMWVNADTESTLEAGFRAIAVDPGAPPADEKDIDAVVKHVLKFLADPSHARWLLVLDNADTEASVLSILDRFMPPPSSNGHVLVTTRLRAECAAMLDLQPSSSLSVSIFSDEDAPVVLLHRSAPRGALSALSFRAAAAPAPSEGDSAARSAWLQDWRRLTSTAKLSVEEAAVQRRADVEIVGKGHLSGHPLAIACAAASIASSAEPSKRFESYLKLLNKKGNTALGALGVRSGVEDVARRAVASSFLISFAGLAPHVQLLLRLIASCAPDNVPLALLGGAAARLHVGHPLSTATERGDADQVRMSVSTLCDFSLVSPIENGCVSFHRLVQETGSRCIRGERGGDFGVRALPRR